MTNLRPTGAPPNARHTAPQGAGEPVTRFCCICGEEIIDDDESAFGACADCLDDVHRDPEAVIEQPV